MSVFKPSSLKAHIAARFKAGAERPLLIESSPGIGKTAIAGQAAKELGVAFKVIHAPLMQPEDYGFPVISADKTDVNFIVSRDKFPIEGSDCPDKGILLIDEVAQADNNAQKILANLVHAREIHGKRLKPGWMIIATGNRAEDRSGANQLLRHFANRHTIVPLEVSLDDWTQWALDNGVKPEVISFIRFRPELLNKFDPQQKISPTPRSWAEGVSVMLGQTDPEHEFTVFQGDVGEGAAAEFVGYLKIYRKLPSPDAIIVNPKSVEVPKDPATLYALCGALAHRAAPDNFGRIMQFVSRIPQEFQVLFVRDALKKTPAIQTSSEFIKWASGDGAKVLL